MKNITNIYEAVDQNRIKSIFVIVFFLAFVTGVAWIVTYLFGFDISVVGVAFLISGLMSIGSWWWSDKIVLTMVGAKPANRKEHFHFYTVAENIALAAGLPKPKLYVLDNPSPNAFATGRNPENAVIVATSGLLQRLDRTELEGVLAHEFSHIGNRDTLLMGIVSVLVGTIAILVDMTMRMSWFGGGRKERDNSSVLMLVGLLAIVLAPFVASAIQAAISRRREFLADATAAKITRFPEGLARALEKIAAYSSPMKNTTNATAHLFIANPFKADVKKTTNWLLSLFNTHPPIEERIKALRAMV